MWLGAEASVEGKPYLIRVRDPARIQPKPALADLLVVEISYALDDDDVEMPSPADYDLISAFERQAFDDCGDELELVLVETGAGRVRYFCYVSDVERAASHIEAGWPGDDSPAFATAPDPEWREFHARVSGLR